MAAGCLRPSGAVRKVGRGAPGGDPFGVSRRERMMGLATDQQQTKAHAESGAPRWGPTGLARWGPPSGATSMAGWALLPLRAFLGGTFAFAGLQKLANPGFFDASNPTSIQSQLASAARVSPIHGLIGHLQHAAVPLGVAIALGELAVGAATLVGLWSRAAAAGGMLLSFSLFLTVSFHASPYYTGSDIVFVFAWTPLLVAGAGGVLSLDAWSRDIARTRRSGARNDGPRTLRGRPEGLRCL